MIRFVPALLLLVLFAAPAGAGPAPQPRSIDPSVVRRELKDIFSAAEYNRANRPNVVRAAMEDIGNVLERILQWLAGVFSFREGEGAAGAASFVFAWIVIAAFLYMLAQVIWRLASLGRGAPPGSDEPDFAGVDLPSAGPLIRRAAAFAESGDYRGAFRCAYLACISHLDEIRALRFERSRTNWEYLRELKDGGHEAAHAQLRPLTADFDRKFYGRESCGRDDYLNAVRAYESLTSETAG